MNNADEWDSREHAQLRAQMLFRGYTQVEIAEVFESVRNARLAFDPSVLRDDLNFVSMPRLRLERDSLTRVVSEKKKVYDAISQLDGLLRTSMEDGDLCDGRWEPDLIGSLYSEARPFLLRIASVVVAEGKSLTELLATVDEPANAAKMVQNDLLDAIADLWSDLGGEVRNTKHFRAFFEAVSKPIYESEFGQANRLSWTPESLVSSCVKKWRAKER